MTDLLRLQVRFFNKPLNLTSRLLLFLAAAAVAAALFFPLWKVRLTAPQYQEGLQLFIYSWKIQGGGLNGNDLNEINNLNHYIGMKPIQQTDFTEMQVMPFMFGVFILLALRAVVFGQMAALIDLRDRGLFRCVFDRRVLLPALHLRPQSGSARASAHRAFHAAALR
ncbi:MAG: hypothetical protein WBL39_04880 [Terrimicrobiaceae bacterium]